MFRETLRASDSLSGWLAGRRDGVETWDEVASMHAVVLHEYGGADKLKYEEVADPVAGPGEVLVRTAATSVNPVDWKQRSGAIRQRMPVEFPAILGRDVSGTVLALGEGVNGFERGDRVMAMTLHTYAEQVVVKAAELTRIPEELDIVDAGALPLVLLTGHQLVQRAVQPEKGWTILVSGAVGSVGRAAVYTAKQAGATVLAGVRGKQRKEAETLGADEVIAIDDKDALGKLGFLDAIADTVGGETGERLLEKVKQGGVFGSVATLPGNVKLHPTVRVERIMAQADAAALRQLAEAVLAKKLVIPVDRMLPLREAAEAQRVAEKGGVGKILLLA